MNQRELIACGPFFTNKYSMKKKFKFTLIFIAMLVSAFNIYAQTDADAFRYSGTTITGTARFTAMSGAFGALGGDFSSLSTNPAGIGIYRRSEITFTPSVFAGTSNSTFLGNHSSESKFNFNFGNAGLIFTQKISKDETSSGWKSWNFGFGYNRLDNYHNKTSYQGKNYNNSLLDYFAENAGKKDYTQLDEFYEYQAYKAYLINPDNDTSLTQYIPAITEYGETQRRTSETRGAKGETIFSFGGNYSNKLFLGATLGLSSLRYSEEAVYEEMTNSHVYDTLNNYRFTQNVTTDGSGVNFKIGFIYKANDNFRFGFAVHTPTWYTMHDEYKNTIKSSFITGQSYSSESKDGSFDYEMTTPFKAIGSLGFVFGKMGLVGFDYEMTDYSSARFSSSSASFFDTNQLIERKYIASHTFKVGTEWKFDNISFRGGMSYSTSPINDNYKLSTSDYSKISYSGGIGIRDEDFSIDLGYLYTQSNQFFQPYTLALENVPGVKQNIASHNFTVTFGFRF